ncbi:MAG: SPOR domain-containing protein [Bacteroidota bacterium]
MRFVLTLFVLGSVLALSACSGPQKPDDPADVPTAGQTPDYETFDPAPYDREPASQTALGPIEHDVPEALMAGQVEPPEPEGPRYVQGFRIQVFSSPDKAAADRVADNVEAWWRSVRRNPSVPSSMVGNATPEVLYLQPYYRVRMGRFQFRDEAESALGFVRQRFGDAFLMPERIRVDG